MAESVLQTDLIRTWFQEHKHRYQTRNTAQGLEVFLNDRLQSRVWEALVQEHVVDTTETLSSAIQKLENEYSNESWVSIDSAVQDYGFMPVGLQKAFAYDVETGAFEGYTVTLYEGGVVVPVLAKDKHELARLVASLIKGATLRRPITYEKPGQGQTENKVIIRVPDRGDSFLLGRQERFLIPITSCQNAIVPSRMMSVISKLRWAQQELIALDPIEYWDEPPAEIIEVAADASYKSPTRDRTYHLLQSILDTYENESSPEAIIKSWSSFADSARDLFPREGLANTSAYVLNNISLDDTETIIEWVNRKTKHYRLRERVKAASLLKEEEIGIREFQADCARDKYPELEHLTSSALAWCWQQYIQDTEGLTDQAGLVETQRIDRRPRDPDFIVHILSRAIDQHKSQGELIHESGGPIVKTMEGSPINIEAKAWFNGVAVILQILIEGQISEDYLRELIEDWRDHYHRVMRAGRQISALQQAVASLEVGPVTGSEWDIKYCRYSQISNDLRIPRHLMTQRESTES